MRWLPVWYHNRQLLCLPPAAGTAASQPADKQQFVQINFPDIDINVLINLISEMTGKNFIVDPAVKGKVLLDDEDATVLPMY